MGKNNRGNGKRGEKRKGKKRPACRRTYLGDGQFSWVNAIAYSTGDEAHTEVIRKTSTGGATIYACPFCIDTKNRAAILHRVAAHQEYVGEQDGKPTLVKRDVNTEWTHKCPNPRCRMLFIIGRDVLPEEQGDELPVLHM